MKTQEEPDGRARRGHFRIDPATPGDTAQLLALIHALAEYERLTAICTSTEADLREALFGPRPFAEALLAWTDGERTAAGFALYFSTYSTFLGRPGLWLEDLFVRPERRGAGIGRALIRRLAAIARSRGCGRFEWSVLDWNGSAIRFYESLGASILPDWRIVRVTGEALGRLAEGATPTGTR